MDRINSNHNQSCLEVKPIKHTDCSIHLSLSEIYVLRHPINLFPHLTISLQDQKKFSKNITNDEKNHNKKGSDTKQSLFRVMCLGATRSHQ